MGLRRYGKEAASGTAVRRKRLRRPGVRLDVRRTVIGLVPIAILGALTWAAGCASPSSHTERTSAAPTRDMAVLGAEDVRRLQATGHAAADCLVHIVTVLREDASEESPPTIDGVPTSFCTGGTGVVVAPDGLILTNEHVCRDAAEVYVVLPDGRKLPVEHIVVDRQLDLAMLKIAATGLPALPMSTRPLSRGLPVVAVGRVEPDEPVTSRPGVILSTVVSLQQILDPTRTRDYAGLIESTTRLEPGFSGGPLLDSAGRLIGLNVAAGSANGAHRGYAIPLGGAVRAAVYRLRAQAIAQATRSEAYAPSLRPR